MLHVSPETDANASLGSPLQKRERPPEPKVPARKQTAARYSHPQADPPQDYGGIVRVAVHRKNVSVAEMVEHRRSAGLAVSGERENGGERGNDARGSRPGSSMSNTSPLQKSGSPLRAISPSGGNRRVRFLGDSELSPEGSSMSNTSPLKKSGSPLRSDAVVPSSSPAASAPLHTLGQDQFKRRPTATHTHTHTHTHTLRTA